MTLRRRFATLTLFPLSLVPLSLASALLISTPALANDDSDKLKHFAVSFALGTASGAYFENKWTAFGVAMIPGLLKEISDSQKSNNHFSGKDMAANALGAALGVQFGNWIITSRGLAFRSTF